MPKPERKMMKQRLSTYLRQLEAESIRIMREVAAEFRNPVMLYSIGKDSSVMLHLALKAFYPAKPPFPLLHVDTTWKFREMIAFRDQEMKRLGLESDRAYQRAGRERRHLADHAWQRALYRHHEDRGAEAGAGEPRLRRGVRRGAARRGEIARQGACVLVPQRRAELGSRSASVPSYGISPTPRSGRARACGYSRCRIGPSWTCGPTSISRTFRWCRSISPPTGRWSSVAAC